MRFDFHFKKFFDPGWRQRGQWNQGSRFRSLAGTLQITGFFGRWWWATPFSAPRELEVRI